MQISWAKGFFRTWAVLAVLWISASGWHAYNTNAFWPQPQDDCLERFAKWPDGRPFDAYERAGFVEYNLKDDANRWKMWREAWQKIEDCEAAKPLMQRVARGVTEHWSSLNSSLQLILLPPPAVLIGGFTLGWIARGFRAKQP